MGSDTSTTSIHASSSAAAAADGTTTTLPEVSAQLAMQSPENATPATMSEGATTSEESGTTTTLKRKASAMDGTAVTGGDCRLPSPRRAPASPPKIKRVRWATITVHEFGVGLGGSSVSDRGGPSIGLSEKPEFTWTTKVGEMAERSEGIHRFSPDQRTRLLKRAGISDGMISRYSRETSIILKSRRKTIIDHIEDSSSSEEEEEIEEEEETEDEDSEDGMYSHKRKADSQHSIYTGHPQFAPMRRPRMIPANYV